MPGIQPQTYITRVAEHSKLSPQALLVALTIAQLRFKKRSKPHEPLPLTGAALAKACHMSERTLDRYLDECIASGWIIGRKIYRNGRQCPHEWFLCDATDSDSECRRLRTEIASGGQILCAGVAGKPRRRLHSVLRSKNNGAADDAGAGDGGSPIQGKTAPTAPPAPQADGPDDAEPQPVGGRVTFTREPEPLPIPTNDQELLDQAQTASRDRKANPFARPGDKHLAHECMNCGGTQAVLRPDGLLYECGNCGYYWPARPRLHAV